MATTAAPSTVNSFDTHHEDIIHDAQLDYYGRRLATASSDATIKLFEVDGETHRQLDTLRGHQGPVWQVAWAHPKFGAVLASCSYDAKVFIWREYNGVWSKVLEHAEHVSSVNSVAWAPHEYGLVLACASSDGKISVITCKEDGAWDTQIIAAHNIGVNAVTWAPAIVPGSLTSSSTPQSHPKRLASAGCDNLIKIWAQSPDSLVWKEEATLSGHSDWVRDVAWAPSIGLTTSYLASCSQDKSVKIWTQDAPGAQWVQKPLKADGFGDVVWRVSWSTAGNILAVSCGDNKVSMWKENLEGEFGQIGEANEGM
ncbi:WD40 repeat-like protein [Rhizoclosmatium globosum]|uniref:WD40 repeat-like protein n=1 Tax=Rhizoclosmatium globosum TaxID=329046 RepID=A0A1Y2B4H1_9FUNG|nr:WD40 repeat-like protein [Rhizoclosmatium globosum]|eukprot:ORY29450.1 WD40 repeat-like protein [Rhizoclosmatium globosum]